MKTAVIVLFMALVPAGFAASRHGYTMDIPAAGVRAISFDVQEGDLVIRGDSSATSVQMHVAIDRYWLFRLGERDILQRLIKVTGEGTPELKIVTDIQPSWRNYGRAEYPIDIEVVVPADALIRVHDTSGKIEISGITSSVQVQDGSGTLSVQRVKGPVDLTKEAGDIVVEDIAGTVTINSRSGQMHVKHVGELNVTASEGNIDVNDAGSVRLINRSGNIQVRSVKSGVTIDDDSGEIQVSDVGGDVSIQDTSGQIRARKVGALTIDDTSGDVVIDGARSVNVRTKESGQVKVKNVAGDVKVPQGITLARR